MSSVHTMSVSNYQFYVNVKKMKYCKLNTRQSVTLTFDLAFRSAKP